MGTIINLKQFVDSSKEIKGSVTRKLGSTKLYVDFYYHGVRIVKTTGLYDTPANEQKARKWLDRAMEKIENGTFVFAEAFPGASANEKNFILNVKDGRMRQVLRMSFSAATPLDGLRESWKSAHLRPNRAITRKSSVILWSRTSEI